MRVGLAAGVPKDPLHHAPFGAAAASPLPHSPSARRGGKVAAAAAAAVAAERPQWEPQPTASAMDIMPTARGQGQGVESARTADPAEGRAAAKLAESAVGGGTALHQDALAVATSGAPEGGLM